MTKERALVCLGRYDRHILHKLKMMKNLWIGPIFQMDFGFQYACYQHFAARELINRIQSSKKPPIQVVQEYGGFMDYILGESDDRHFGTHNFAGEMVIICEDILRYLRWEEENE